MARLLGIETSCDETAAAVVEDGARVLSNIVLSQVPIHRMYGGIVPELASREHLRAIVPVVRQALEQAQTTLGEIDAIAVTHGPGLVGALLVGLTYAKSLALASGKPWLGVNHLEGHLHAVLLEERGHGRPDPPLPAIALVVSGGHTQLYRVDDDGEGGLRYRRLGQTRDDAAGEAYDKVAKVLGLGYPGGPLLDRLAPFGRPGAVKFPRVRMKSSGLDFSFSGLKTAVLRYVQTHAMEAGITARRQAIGTLGHPPTLDDWKAQCDETTLDLIAGFQDAVTVDLTARTLAALEQSQAEGETPVASIFLTGGVAANRSLRQRMGEAAKQAGVGLFQPAIGLCTDNAAMIAAAGWPRYRRRQWSGYELAAFAQLPLGEATVE